MEQTTEEDRKIKKHIKKETLNRERERERDNENKMQSMQRGG